ncbi:MAG: hypothetical protein QME61_02565 [Patescibacteria group bacterium]|nr:hypothetical protein [Patescibacteria group bacterium]
MGIKKIEITEIGEKIEIPLEIEKKIESMVPNSESLDNSVVLRIGEEIRKATKEFSQIILYFDDKTVRIDDGGIFFNQPEYNIYIKENEKWAFKRMIMPGREEIITRFVEVIATKAAKKIVEETEEEIAKGKEEEIEKEIEEEMVKEIATMSAEVIPGFAEKIATRLAERKPFKIRSREFLVKIKERLSKLKL